MHGGVAVEPGLAYGQPHVIVGECLYPFGRELIFLHIDGHQFVSGMGLPARRTQHAHAGIHERIAALPAGIYR